jgi:hypothetical protein
MTRSQGTHGDGARSYKPEQAAAVLHILRNDCVGPDHLMTVDELADRVGMPGKGRAVRDIVRDLELQHLVLTNFGDGYFVCCTRLEAERSTRRLESQVKHMQERIDARRVMAEYLP